jgi:hypothetical protein
VRWPGFLRFQCRWFGLIRKPEVSKYPNNLVKLTRIDRFTNVSLGVLRKGRMSAGFFRGREDNHWNLAESRIGFEFGENHSSIFARKVEIQKDKLWSESLRIFALTSKEAESLYTIIDRVNMVYSTDLRKSFDGKKAVGHAVFHEEYFKGLKHKECFLAVQKDCCLR